MLQSSQHSLRVLRRVGYSGFESAAQRLSPTSPSSGQATITSQLRHPKLLACHSRAAFGVMLRYVTGRQSFIRVLKPYSLHRIQWLHVLNIISLNNILVSHYLPTV
jgi:hypothetical protein